MKDRFEHLPLESIVPAAYNPRKHFGEAELEDLKTSIIEKGVIEPIVVLDRRIGDGSPDLEYEIICGERRFRAAQLAGLDRIPAIVKEGMTQEQALEFAVVENLQRVDINPIDEARAFKTLIDTYSHTPASIAEKTGKRVDFVTSRLRLLDLHPDVQELVLSGELSFGHGLVVSRIDYDRQVEFAQHIIKDCLSVKSAEQELRRMSTTLKEAQFDTTVCKECEYNGTRQKDLFDPETNLDGRCLNVTCFKAKTEAFISNTLTEKKKLGASTLTEKEFSKQRQQLRGTPVDLSRNCWENNRKKLGKLYKERCERCPSHVYSSEKPYYQDIPSLIEVCMKPSCFRSLISPKTEKPSAAGSGDVDNRAHNRIVETRERFLKDQLVKILADGSMPKLKLIVMAHHLLNRLESGTAKDIIPAEYRLKNSYATWNWKSLSRIPDEVLSVLIDHAVLLWLKQTYYGDIEEICAANDIKIESLFSIDAEYLNRHVKANLVKLAKELSVAPPARGYYNLSKGDIVRHILAAAPAGVPAELRKQY